MKRNLLTRLIIASCLLGSYGVASAESAVWEISKGANKLFLGGTIHVLKDEDYPLPPEFKQAFDNAEVIVFETNIGALSTEDFQREMLSQSQYGDGKTLQTELTPETWKALEAFCKQRGILLDQFKVFKPSLITTVIALAELNRLGITSMGVDQYFYRYASTARKEIDQLESIETQMKLVTGMGEDLPNELILNTINEIGELEDLMDKARVAWRKGDAVELGDLFIADLQKDFPSLYQSMLIDRNLNWMPKIIELMNTPDVELILVGALHLAGDQGLLTLLKEKGFDVKHYSE